MRLRLTHRFLLLLIACLAAPASQAMTDFTLQLRWTHQFQFAGYYVALAAIMQTSPIVWIVRADSGIHTPLDLAGKRLMLMPPPESAELLAMLRREGMDTDQLELVPTSFDLDDLITGVADAYDGYETNEPHFLEQQGIDYRLLRPREYGVNFYNDVLITREDLAENQPREVEAFRDASLKGWDYALNHIDETVDLIHRKYAPHKSREHLRFEAERIRELVMPDLVELGQMNPARWESIAQSYVDLGMAEGPVDLRGFLYEEYTEPGRTWPYMMALGSVAAMLLISLVTMRIARLNRKLVREAARRQRVEQELLENQEKLYKLANTDQLTGVWNRLKLDQIAREEIERARRYQYPISLIFMDVDNFKAINDVHGHGVGDQVLIDVANLVGRQLREADWLCRWGGEEFLVLLPHAGLQAAAELAERLRTAVDAVIPSSGERVTVSIGVAELGENDALSDLIVRADGALYRAKAGGRDQVALDFGN